MCICTCGDSQEMALTVMEAGRSHSRLSTSWRPRKASDVIQSQSEGLRSRGADGVNLSPRAGKSETRCPNSSSEAGEEGQIPPSSAFVFRP